MDQRIEFTPVQVVTLTAVLLLAFAASLGMPFNVDAIALSFSASNFDAGKVASTELAAIAAGNLIFARLASKMDPHRVYLFGALAILGFNTASLFATDIGDLLLLRAPAGFALGAVVSTVMATAARSASPELTFGIINSMVGVMAMGLALVLPRALNAHEFVNANWPLGGVVWNELDGLFAVYVLCSLAALPFIRFTPGQSPASLQQGGGAPKGIGWLALFGLGIIFHGHGTLALFLVKIGRGVPLDAEVVGYVMMAGAFIGIVAPLVAGGLQRPHRRPPALDWAAIPLVALLAFCCPVFAVEYQHGYAFLSEPKYAAGFTRFDYVNPEAPKGGMIRVPEMGNWDNFNEASLRGRVVRGMEFWTRWRNYVYDSLMDMAMDEPATTYGLLAEGIAWAPDFSWVQFKLRDGPRWHDGAPVTVDDVVFSFDAYRFDARPAISTPLRIIDSVAVVGPREVRFNIVPAAHGNPIVPRRLGVVPIIPKHYWAERDLSRTTVEPPLGSGPYRIGEFAVGRWIKFERVADYWARDLPIMKGRYNFDTIKIDYFRDDQVQTEAIKAHVVDLHLENVPRRWTQSYDIPALEQGYLKKDVARTLRPAGLWWPIFWNLEQPRFQDVRVREALWLAKPGFDWGNRRSYGFWGEGKSFFHDSEFASRGLPSERELKLLEPLRGQIPERVFTTPFDSAPHGEFGWHRDNLERAAELLREAGWVIEDGALVHEQTGEPFHIRFVAVSPALGRAFIAYTRILERLGISASIKAPEISNWLYRMRSGDFDAGAIFFLPDNTPTLLISNTFSSAAADAPYSDNWSGLKDPAVDALIGHVYAAKNWDDFVAALRALDRVLLWNFYWMPNTSKTRYPYVRWDKFGRPEHGRLLWVESLVAHWWWDAEKAARVRAFAESG